MLADDHPDRIQIAFDDHRLVANAGLILPATLGRHLGLPQLVDRHLDLGDAPGRAHPGDKVLTLVASALAGGDCIDDADALRAGGTAGAIGRVVKAPSTLGTFLRSFRWGHVRQLDRVGRELLARAWAAGAGPGDGPLTIDLDSTICETYGLVKEGACRHSYTGQRGWHRRAERMKADLRCNSLFGSGDGVSWIGFVCISLLDTLVLVRLYAVSAWTGPERIKGRRSIWKSVAPVVRRSRVCIERSWG